MILSNDRFLISINADAGTFSAEALPSRTPFLSAGRLSATGGTARAISDKSPAFGKGKALEITYPDGSRDRLSLFPKLPFVLFRHTLHNAGAEVAVHRSVRPLAAALDLAAPAAELRALGTGGLTAPDRHPGSYAWLAVADPRSRRGVVAGWLTHDRGSGVLFSKVADGRVRLEAQIDYGRLRAAAGADVETETLAIGYFEDARLGMEAWAEAVAKTYDIHLPPQPVGYCTWYHAAASNSRELAAQSEFAAEHLAPFGFTLMQIDDGWQAGTGGGNGPKKVFLDHDPKGPYPEGMKPVADAIKARGLRPGIWFMPFAGTHNDPFFAEHQDWFVKTADGKPYDTAWGGTCLDMTHPGARDYLRRVVQRIGGEWGYTYFKLDGMWTGSATKQIYVCSGYQDEGIGDAVFSDPEKTNIEAYRDGIRLVRDTAGRGVFLLGCCAPQNMRSFGGAFGLVDAMRIGPDNGCDWNSLRVGPLFGSRNYHLHGRIWYNDPDPVYVRPDAQLAHAQLICSWVTISGCLNLSSELMPALPPERLDLLKRTMPGHGLLPRPVDLFEHEPARAWLLTDERREPRRDVLALYNWESEPIEIELAAARAGLPEAQAYAAFDYWANAFLPAFGPTLRAALPKESCRVLAVRPMLERPFLISTSRHITQGVVDVLEERWETRHRTLRGRSEVVAADPYELRIVAPQAPTAWRAARAEVSAEDAAAGVAIEMAQAADGVRAVIRSPASRAVAWAVKFE